MGRANVVPTALFSSRPVWKLHNFGSTPPRETPSMNTEKKKKQWITPSVKVVMIFFECTSYAGAV